MKNERYRPVEFADCGCRLDLVDKAKYEGTMCKFHENVLYDKIMKKIIYGDENVETGI